MSCHAWVFHAEFDIENIRFCVKVRFPESSNQEDRYCDCEPSGIPLQQLLNEKRLDVYHCYHFHTDDTWCDHDRWWCCPQVKIKEEEILIKAIEATSTPEWEWDT